jgi:hypothetical protein
MAQEDTSLSAVAEGGSYTGAAVTPTNPFANASMVVSVPGYQTAGEGSDTIQVALQLSHDGTNWATIGTVNYGDGPPFVNVAGCPGISLRAVILGWGGNVTAGAVTATVCGV